MLMTLPGPASLIATAPDGRMLLVESDVSEQSAAAAAAAGSCERGIEHNVRQYSEQYSQSMRRLLQRDHATDVQFLEFDLAQQAQGT